MEFQEARVQRDLAMEFQEARDGIQINEKERNIRNPYRRRTPEELQQLEAFYNQNPHPSDEERTALSEQLGLGSLQVKFWFQNRRRQRKKESETKLNETLRYENLELKIENSRLKKKLSSVECYNCDMPFLEGTDADGAKLMVENALLKEKIKNMFPGVKHSHH
ncbi:uncharacterized protein A4U43_C04F31570 [Asparagus officinalis]|uniref:Homeobox domain-containing protein n=1 Tax=Asparagus officinalis TaxID=4686 RepID=A0A5P1F4Z8_ASPOF|nr:uncharacterized protein A4U43_C04F31570 [Asparagus officinalis]